MSQREFGEDRLRHDRRLRYIAVPLPHSRRHCRGAFEAIWRSSHDAACHVELSQPEAPSAVREWAGNFPTWLKVISPNHVDHMNQLDVGEASAISLASELSVDLLLIDERAGTEVARRLGLKAIGTLGIIIEAGVEDLIDFEASLAILNNETSFYGSDRLIGAAWEIFEERRRQRGLR